MFDFEKLDIYQKAKTFSSNVYRFIKDNKSLDRTTKDQFRRASFSIMLNIAEGSGRFSKPDRKHFFTIARGSVYESVAICDFLKDEKLMDEVLYKDYYNKCEQLSKMLYTMIKNLNSVGLKS